MNDGKNFTAFAHHAATSIELLNVSILNVIIIIHVMDL